MDERLAQNPFNNAICDHPPFSSGKGNPKSETLEGCTSPTAGMQTFGALLAERVYRV